MRIMRWVLGLVLLLVLLAATAFYVWSSRPEIAAIDPPGCGAFDPALIAEGARLAAIGNCDVCHTLPGGTPYAGGRPIPTPFGTIYSTNITPDPEAGIGRWPEEAFRRAMRDGVARDGSHLYPAFPYDHYARLGDDDLHALYAYIITREPAGDRPPGNALPFPLTIRRLIAAWNVLYLDRAPLSPDPGRSAEWNRGALLVAGLGHCGDCHTPRNPLGAERRDQPLAGGQSEGWLAPALNAASPAPRAWDADQIFAYLRGAADAEHGMAAGPMAPVVHDLSRADERDVRAIAAYVASLSEVNPPARRQGAEAREAAGSSRPSPAGDLGAMIFAGACARCHEGEAPPQAPRGIDLASSTPISAPEPSDAIFIVLDGIRPGDGESGPWMPRFDGAFTDGQMAALLAYLRSRYSDRQPWPDLEKRVRDIRLSKERS